MLFSPIDKTHYNFAQDHDLQKALEDRNYQLIEKLIDHNPKLLNSVPGHLSPLAQASQNDDLKLAGLLLEKEGIDVNSDWPLSRVKSLAMAKLLLDKGANPNLKVNNQLPIDVIKKLNKNPFNKENGIKVIPARELIQIEQLFAQKKY